MAAVLGTRTITTYSIRALASMVGAVALSVASFSTGTGVFSKTTSLVVKAFLAVIIMLSISGYSTGMALAAWRLKLRTPPRSLPPRRLAWSVAGISIATVVFIAFVLAGGLGVLFGAGGDNYGGGFAVLILLLAYPYVTPLAAAMISVMVLTRRPV